MSAASRAPRRIELGGTEDAAPRGTRRAVDPARAAQTMRAAGLEPLDPYPGSDAPWRCTCTRCGRGVTPRYSNVQRGRGGCRYCANRGRALDPARAAETMRAAGLEPLEPYPGSQAPWRCRCARCGAEIAPRYANVQQGGGGCLYCAERGRALDPARAAEVMRAAGLEPLEPYPGSETPWRCRCTRCGREVAPRHGHVRRGKGGCRFCAGVGGAALDPGPAAERMRAVGLEPLEPYPGSKTPWRCRCARCGAEIAPRYTTIQQGQGGCRHCTGNALDPGRAAETMRAAGLEPLEPYPGSHTPWRCTCTRCGREVTPRHNSVQRGGGCRHCAGNIGRPLDPGRAAETMRAAGLEPLEPYPGSKTPWRCRCARCGEEVTPRYTKIQQGQGGCRFCARAGGKALDPAQARARIAANRMDPARAVEAMRFAGLDPLEPYPGSKRPWRCRCTRCGAEVAPRYNDIQKGRGGCLPCAGNIGRPLDPGRAAETMRAAGLEPLEPYPGSDAPWRCTCTSCGREVTSRYLTVRRGGGGCRHCAGNIVDPCEAAEVMRAAGLEPLGTYPGGKAPWRCRCARCGAEVAPRYTNVQQGKGGCRFCARAGGKALDPARAAEVMRAAGLDPLEPYPGSTTPWKCTCTRCGRQVTPRYNNVRQGGCGCRHCGRARR